jgi:hypothetical protein
MATADGPDRILFFCASGIEVGATPSVSRLNRNDTSKYAGTQLEGYLSLFPAQNISLLMPHGRSVPRMHMAGAMAKFGPDGAAPAVKGQKSRAEAVPNGTCAGPSARLYGNRAVARSL